MAEPVAKTIICSVFFLDIVEYSKKSVSGQISLKERFNAFLSAAISGVPVTDRIILDTGDGAAISFLGDVEDALRASLSMRKSLLSEEGLADPPLLVRMGVNLGPVRLVKDINGQPNIVGDGINVAQRVMGFSEPGQILVSRSYYDAASRLSQDYAGMFHYEGSRTDKHVREHEVYAIGYPGDMAREYKKSHSKIGLFFSATTTTLFATTWSVWSGLVAKANVLTSSVIDVLKNGTHSQKALYVGIIAIPFLLTLLVIKLAVKHVEPVKESHKTLVVDSVPEKEVGKLNAASSVPEATAINSPKDKSQNAMTLERKDKKEAKSKTEVKEKKEAKSVNNSKPTEHATASGSLVFTIRPWGEIYLDGNLVGVSPPLTKLSVAVGDHTIEIKNTTFPAFKQSIKITPGEKEQVVHKFAN
jgi:hypothetical protein